MLLYKATKDVDLLQASNRVSLLSLLRSIQSNPEPHLAIPLALSRRLLQVVRAMLFIFYVASVALLKNALLFA